MAEATWDQGADEVRERESPRPRDEGGATKGFSAVRGSPWQVPLLTSHFKCALWLLLLSGCGDRAVGPTQPSLPHAAPRT